jgi:hypothetical protein
MYVRKLDNRIMRMAALALVAVYLLPGLALADDLVLCVSEDGRVSVEEARKGRCSSSHDAPHQGGRHEGEDSCLSSQKHCCGSCLDIPMTSSSSQAQQVPDDKGDSRGPNAAACACDRIDTQIDSSLTVSADSPGVLAVARSTLRILRSVVIVI